jgi:hypothetical protein
VDAFAFLKALRDYNEEYTRHDKSQEDTKDNETQQQQQQQQQQRVVNRNNFGGMAFFGGDESGKRGRVGRRRVEKRQEQQVPSRESFDDAMFDFHSQSSMPASQVSAALASTSQEESTTAMRAPCVREQNADESMQVCESLKTADEPTTALQQKQQEKTDSAAGKDHSQQDSSSQKATIEDSHKESQERSTGEDHSQIADNTTASSRQQHMYQTETEPVQKESSQCTSTTDMQMEESEQGQQAQMDESESQQNNEAESKQMNESDGACVEQQELSPELLQDSQEESQVLISTEDSDVTTLGERTEEKTTEPPKASRRVTILSPTADASATTSTRKVNYQSIITPASSSRKRQRTESQSQRQQSPLTNEKDNAELDQARAKLYNERDDILANHPTCTADELSDHKMAPGVHDAEVDTTFLNAAACPKGVESASQGSLQSNHPVAPTTTKHYSPPTQQSETLSVASGALPGTQELNALIGSHLDGYTLPKSGVQVAHGNLNVPPSIYLHELNVSKNTSSQGDGGNSVLEAGLRGRHDGTVDSTGPDISEDTQQTLLMSQDLPNTCDFQSLLPSLAQEVAASNERSGTMFDAKEAGTNSGAEDETGSGSKCDVASVNEQFEEETTAKISHEADVGQMERHHVSSPPSTDTQDTFIPSQALPDTCDFQMLLASKPDAPSIDGASGQEERITSSTTPAFRPTTQESSNSQTSLASTALPSSGDFRSLMPPPSASPSSRESSRSSQPFIRPRKLDSRLSSESSTTVLHERQEISIADKEGHIEKVPGVLLYHQEQRPAEHQEASQPSTDTQETFIPSQALPSTCDFQSLLPPVPPDNRKGKGSVSVATTTACPADNEMKITVPCQSSKRSRSDSDITCLDGDSQNSNTFSPASDMLPTSKDLGGLLRLHSRDREAQSGSPRSDQPLGDHAPKDEEGNGRTQNFDDEPASETQQTTLLSQCLPNTADFLSLLKSNTEQGKRASAERGNNVSDKVSAAPEDPLDGDKSSEKGPTSDFHKRLRDSQPKQHDAITSQVSIFSQYLPKTCDFRTILPSQASDDSDTSMPAPRMVMDDALEDADFERARRLCEADMCSADCDISSSTSHYVVFTKTEHNPLSPKALTEICLPRPGYFKAIALGIPVVDKKWLKATEIAGRCPRLDDTYRVWGDSQLAQKVNAIQRGSDKYDWLKSAEWFQKHCGPGQLPPNMSTRALNGYCILVPDQDYCKPSLGSFRSKTQSRPRTADALYDISTRENGAAIDPDSFQEFNAQDLETLCNLLGAEVVETEDELVSSDTELTRLILMPASMPPACFRSFIEQKLVTSALANNMGVVTNTPHFRQFCALRSTWLTDSIGARCHAPLADYSYGILIHGEQRTPDLSDFKRGRFSDRNDSQLESVADI